MIPTGLQPISSVFGVDYGGFCFKMVDKRYYQEFDSFKEISSPGDVSKHIVSGWELLKIVEKHTSTETKNGIILNSVIVYVVGLPKDVSHTISKDKVKTSDNSSHTELFNEIKDALGEDFSEEIHIGNSGHSVRMDYLPDKAKWLRIGEKLKKLGFTWVPAGKDSQWVHPPSEEVR